ncbi:MAG TPA: type II toxin-antitoxin system RelE/ParE family toxin [Acidobacteriaceae bacterium]|nr:type II toxin-antitoxin system RelE/ParE family toxin [Acidobacteriaceae bacterium]
MKPVLVWTPQAQQDVIEIYVTIGLESASAAERLYNAIEERALLLIRHPRLGVRRPEIASSARMLVENKYVILYETHPDTDEGTINQVEIVRVIHGNRDVAAVF